MPGDVEHIVDAANDFATVHESALTNGSGRTETVFDDNDEVGQNVAAGEPTNIATGNLLTNDGTATSIVSIDGTEYIRLAGELMGNPVYGSSQPYGYPFLILLVHALGAEWVTAARIVDLIAGLALIPLTWLLTRHVVSHPALRLIPALGAALLPLTVRYSITTMTEAPYLALLLGAFLLVVSRRFLAGGILVGLAYCVRPEALTAGRSKAAQKLARAGQKAIRGLALAEARFAVDLDPATAEPGWPCGPNGAEAPVFRFSADHDGETRFVSSFCAARDGRIEISKVPL